MSTLSDPGTLVRARSREWVVLPDSTEDLLLVKPLGGLDEEITGILPGSEEVASASFSLPDEGDLGDSSSGRLLRDAARLSTRAAAGPFRCFARIFVEPRPYQLVPLMMALKQDPVRLLIADDVGIGKTVEASLVARELLDRGEIRSIAVLCPPHLAEQWQKDLRSQFHIDAQLILSSTIKRLERDLPVGVSVFERHPFTIVSLDYIKSQSHAADFVRKCPDLVIVDEAHTCTLSGGVGRGHQQRFALLQSIAKREGQHLVLVTATPHSGNENAFRSLLSLLDEEFGGLPLDIVKEERTAVIKKLAAHLVQRRRSDLVDFDHEMKEDTTFPQRKDKEVHYAFTPAYRALFDDIVTFLEEYVGEEDSKDRYQRVRFWSALALLRCVSSSPAAAVATLRSRAAVDGSEAEDVDEVGRRTVLDQGDEDSAGLLDLTPGTQVGEDRVLARERLLEFADRAEALADGQDAKLKGAVRQIKDLLDEGYRPIVFCRFVETAEYVARHLMAKLRGVRVEAVTGTYPPADREKRIEELVAGGGKFVLVATDCLSEGVNMQEHFNAVMHYDLAWTPTRHEQREGRVDRYGQKSEEVRVVTYFGRDNPIDGVMLDVLIRRHKQIKNDLQVTIAVPRSSEEIAQALFEGALFRRRARGAQATLFHEEDMQAMRQDLHEEWRAAAEREKKSRSRFAQHQLDKETVARELEAVRKAIGSQQDVERFFRAALRAARVGMADRDGSLHVNIDEGTRRSLRQALGVEAPFQGRFTPKLGDGDVYLGRTSPLVEGLAGWVLDQALDSEGRDGDAVAARLGIMVTKAVEDRVTVLLARFRYHLKTGKEEGTMLAEEIVPLAYTGPPEAPVWLSDEVGEALLASTPARNLTESAMAQQLERFLPRLPGLRKALEPVAEQRAAEQREAHRRVRQATKLDKRITVKPVLPVDILGAYVLLPAD